MAAGLSFPTTAWNFEFSDFHESTTSLRQFLTSFPKGRIVSLIIFHKASFQAWNYTYYPCFLYSLPNTLFSISFPSNNLERQKSPFHLKEFPVLLLHYGFQAYIYLQPNRTQLSLPQITAFKHFLCTITDARFPFPQPSSSSFLSAQLRMHAFLSHNYNRQAFSSHIYGCTLFFSHNHHLQAFSSHNYGCTLSFPTITTAKLFLHTFTDARFSFPTITTWKLSLCTITDARFPLPQSPPSSFLFA